MYENKKILALIPARGGSKGLPQKNIKDLLGKPLIAWTIEAAKKSKYIDRVIVSTDDLDIAKISKKFGAEVPFMRSPELATDTASSADVIINCLNWIKENEGLEYECLILLQATSPIRDSLNIDESIEKFYSNSKIQSLVSVSKVKKSPYWMKIINEDGFLKDFLEQDKKYVRRQDLQDLFVLNGAIYIIKSKDFFIYKSFNTPFTSCYRMEDYHSVDIDDEYDFVIAETLMEKFLKS